MNRDRILQLAREAGVLAAHTLHLYRKEDALCDSEIQALRAAERLAQAAYAAGAAAERYRNPLSDEQIRDLLEKEFLGEAGKRNLRDDLRIARAIEQAHMIGSRDDVENDSELRPRPRI